MSFEKDLLSTVQSRLADLGYYKGKLDGVYGPLTSIAMTDFKRENGFTPRDYPGIQTLTKLFSEEARPRPPLVVSKDPPWVVEAKRLIGTSEWAGDANNPIIMKWAKDLDQWYPDDDTAWCGLFTAHCMAVGAPNEPQDFNRLRARQWLEFGEEKEASYGAVTIFWRGRKDGPFGHVGFLVGEDDTTYHILGGNQSNSVNVVRISKQRLLGFRGPTGWTGEKELTSVLTEGLSTNER